MEINRKSHGDPAHMHDETFHARILESQPKNRDTRERGLQTNNTYVISEISSAGAFKSLESKMSLCSSFFIA